MQQEVIYSIALSHLPHVGLVIGKRLYEEAGSATLLFENRNNIRDVIPDASDLIVNTLRNWDDAIKVAEAEMEFIERKRITALCPIDPRYPQRLRECNDAPITLFFCGNADLNQQRIISIIGTRKCTQYGKDICRDFISELSQRCPNLLIVSGLAYGIDINAHRASLHNSVPTVGVLAHGLDRIYPAMHRQTAVEMVEQGGLLTEFLSGTTPEKINFVQRNRIVAGMADATIVVESASHGGSLITANLANDYNREVFAFPGRIFDSSSAGCNRLISEQKAAMITSTDSFLEYIGWAQPQANPAPHEIQRQLFPELTPDQTTIVDLLGQHDDMQVNLLVLQTGMSFHQVSSILFELECKGIVQLLGGARYRLCR